MTVNKEPFNPKSGADPRRDAGTHPVLARLPDVSGQPLIQPRPAGAAAGFVDYRIDRPAGAEPSSTHSRQRVQPPAFKRSPRTERRSPAYGGASRALPDSNPFAIPSASLVDQLAPVARFLALFLIFTAVGTFVLSTTRERSSGAKPEQTPSAAAPAGVQQILEPTPDAEHPTIATPKVFGPLGANSNKAASERSPARDVAPPVGESDPEPSGERLPALAGANGEPLPQVRTTEIAAPPEELEDSAAPARLTGTIRSSDESPTEDVRKPPAVARLPSIFDPPRNAYQ
jgi:hypothetical protein